MGEGAMLEDEVGEAASQGTFELRQEGTAMQRERQGAVCAKAQRQERAQCVKIQQGSQGSYRGQLRLGKLTGVSHPGP